MHRFYCPDIADTLTLGEEDSKHCVKVLRMAEGDTIEVVDGNGNLYTCRISMAHPKRCAIEVLDKQHHDPHWGHRIVLGIAPTKNLDRIEWLVEKCVEMGVDRIIPLRCHNSERTVLKTERLKKIMVSAMKQSLKATLPRPSTVYWPSHSTACAASPTATNNCRVSSAFPSLAPISMIAT